MGYFQSENHILYNTDYKMFTNELKEIKQLEERINTENEKFHAATFQNERISREIQCLERCKTEKELIIEDLSRKLHQKQEEISLIKDDLMKKYKTSVRSLLCYEKYMNIRFHMADSNVYIISFLRDKKIIGSVESKYDQNSDCWRVSKIVFDGYDTSNLTNKLTNITCLQQLLYLVHEWLTTINSDLGKC